MSCWEECRNTYFSCSTKGLGGHSRHWFSVYSGQGNWLIEFPSVTVLDLNEDGINNISLDHIICEGSITSFSLALIQMLIDMFFFCCFVLIILILYMRTGNFSNTYVYFKTDYFIWCTLSHHCSIQKYVKSIVVISIFLLF